MNNGRDRAILVDTSSTIQKSFGTINPVFLWQSISRYGWVPNESGVLVRAGSGDDRAGVAAGQVQPLLDDVLGLPHDDQVVAGTLHHPQEDHGEPSLCHPAVRKA